jgi:hypothetical protein
LKDQKANPVICHLVMEIEQSGQKKSIVVMVDSTILDQPVVGPAPTPHKKGAA